MPSGIYKRTNEHKRKITEGMMGHVTTNETRKKISDSHKANPQRYWLGKKRSIEDRKKMSLGITRNGRPYTPQSEETKKKHSISMMGKNKYPKTEEHKQKIREYVIAHPNLKRKDTKIELKVEVELKKRNIIYQKQVPLCKIANVDFYLPDDKIIIQCDGCYWHDCPEHCLNDNTKIKDRDKKQDIVLKSNGYKVYRFWEHEINKSVEECINSIEYFCQKATR